MYNAAAKFLQLEQHRMRPAVDRDRRLSDFFEMAADHLVDGMKFAGRVES